MKRKLSLLAIVMLLAVGCSKPESKLIGRWKSPEIKGFEAEFKADHTGSTWTPVQGHAGSAPNMQTPFKWDLEKDGTIKITEGTTVFTGKFLSKKKLEFIINDGKTVLERVK